MWLYRDSNPENPPPGSKPEGGMIETMLGRARLAEKSHAQLEQLMLSFSGLPSNWRRLIFLLSWVDQLLQFFPGFPSPALAPSTAKQRFSRFSLLETLTCS